MSMMRRSDMGEALRIFNERMEAIGIKDRHQVHLDGDWHETFHCWLYEQENHQTFIYLQKRADDKKDFPSLYDITAAGHVEASEDILKAGLREIEEEIGLAIQQEDLQEIGFHKEKLVQDQLQDFEICRTFLCRIEGGEKLTTSEEVSDIIKVEFGDFIRMVSAGERVRHQSVCSGREGTLSLQEVVPHTSEYFKFIIRHVVEKVEKL
ncbi:NUDIX domain-containing protein [Halobacillus fulvus]|nr:NUDIX domain-containing protein [Halobacillus fulvus]